MSNNEPFIRYELSKIEAVAARLTRQLRRVEGERARLLAELVDNEGLHDRRPVGVR
jgi:hypothetical protein